MSARLAAEIRFLSPVSGVLLGGTFSRAQVPDLVLPVAHGGPEVLGLTDLRHAEYGQPRKETVMGRDVFHLALVHTRQAGKHGRYSHDWHDRHHEWLRRLSKTPPNWLDELRHAS